MWKTVYEWRQKKLLKYVIRIKERLFGVVGECMEDEQSDKKYKKRKMDKINEMGMKEIW